MPNIPRKYLISLVIVTILATSTLVGTYIIQQRTQTESEASEKNQQDQQPGYVPGELIVKLKPPSERPSAPAFGPSLEELDQQFGVVSKEEVFKTTTPPQKGTRLGAPPAQTWKQHVEEIKTKFPQRTQRTPADTQTPNLSGISVYKLSDKGIDIQTIVDTYSAHPAVEYAEPNYMFSAQLTPNDPLFEEEREGMRIIKNGGQWAPQKIQAEQAWNITTGSENTTVAVIDTGIDTGHPDLHGNISGYDFVNNSSYVTDENGHGTHVAGIIGAITNNRKGIAGTNWRTKLLNVKVLDNNGFGSTSDVVAGIRYSVDNGADVLNLSLTKRALFGSGPFCTNLMQQAINYARSLGAVVVAAAGNRSSTGGEDANLYQPASCQGVIAVGATDPDDKRARYSNYGSVVDLSAPGGDCRGFGSGFNLASYCGILSTFRNLGNTWSYSDGDYRAGEGTSLAAPHVAGAVSLIIDLKPSLTIDEIETVLKQSTDPVSTAPSKPIGGRLNLYKALLSAKAFVSTTSCNQLLDKVKNTLTAACGDNSYDPVADINHDKVVDILDLSAVTPHLNDPANGPAWCQQKLTSTANPCSLPDTKTYDLRQGWNLIGIPYTPFESETLTAQDICTSIDSSAGNSETAVAIYKWNRQAQTWEGHPCTIPAQNNFTVKAGEGYFVNVGQDTNWTYDGKKLESFENPVVDGWNMMSAPRGYAGTALQLLNSSSTDTLTCTQLHT